MRSYIACLLMICWLYAKLVTNRRQESGAINRRSITINRKTVLTASVIALLYWFLEGTVDSAIFPDIPLLRSLFPVDLHELWMRSFILCLIVIFSIYIHSAITMLQESRISLQAEKNKLQAMIDAMDNGITIQNLDYEIIYQNQVVIDIFGHRIGEKCYRVYEGNDKLCDGCPVKMAFEDGKSHTVVREVVMPSGEIAFWENTANPIRDAQGEIISCLEIGNNITERKQAEEDLYEYQQRLRSLASELSNAEEQTRRKIAVELHDNIGHDLAITKMKTETLFEELTNTEYSSSVNEIVDSIIKSIKDVSSFTFELSPAILYESGLDAAVEWLAGQFEEQSGIICRFNGEEQGNALSGDLQVLLFRCIKELLTYIRKYAQAKMVFITAEKDSTDYRVTVEDDGIGFDPSSVTMLKRSSSSSSSGGFGLFSITERLNFQGGSIEINSENQKGSMITLTVPLLAEVCK